jgi:hypothetical protein
MVRRNRSGIGSVRGAGAASVAVAADNVARVAPLVVKPSGKPDYKNSVHSAGSSRPPARNNPAGGTAAGENFPPPELGAGPRGPSARQLRHLGPHVFVVGDIVADNVGSAHADVLDRIYWHGNFGWTDNAASVARPGGKRGYNNGLGDESARKAAHNP